MEYHWEQFQAALVTATNALEPRYFALAVAGKAQPAVRERAYCYELYHRLRIALPPETDFPYSLHGEIDKRGHKLLADAVRNRNPDFVVHKPGEHGGDANLAVVQVKACGALGDAPTKDADSLLAFVHHADYFKSVALNFGGHKEALANHIRAAFAFAKESADRISI